MYVLWCGVRLLLNLLLHRLSRFFTVSSIISNLFLGCLRGNFYLAKSQNKSPTSRTYISEKKYSNRVKTCSTGFFFFINGTSFGTKLAGLKPTASCATPLSIAGPTIASRLTRFLMRLSPASSYQYQVYKQEGQRYTIK